MISRLHISAILLIAAGVWGVALILAGVPVTAAWFRPFSVVVGVLVLVLSIADRWLWRLRWLRPWLFNMPDLNGTWKVVIHPTPPEPPHDEVSQGELVLSARSPALAHSFDQAAKLTGAEEDSA